MRFRQHFNLDGKHALFGASKYHWIRYDMEKMETIFANQFESALGTRKHEWAAEAIRLGLRQERSNKTLNMYINDAIGFGMTPEVVLYFSDNCFGTADAIKFEDQVLRIHDLKTGRHPASFDQTMIYCAYFCLEYRFNPYDLEMIMRIYQNDEVLEMIADPKEIRRIMDKAIQFDARADELKELMM